MVLIVSQAVLAKTSLSLKAGYGIGIQMNRIFDYEGVDEIDPYDIVARGLNLGIGLSGDYYVSNKTSLAFGLSASIVDPWGAVKVYYLNADLFAKFDIVKKENFRFGFQAGLIYSNIYFLYGTTGLYIGGYPIPKLNLYADLKVTLGMLIIDRYKKSGHLINAGLAFAYDLTCGISYDISPKVTLGIEGNYTVLVREPISIGAKLSFNF